MFDGCVLIPKRRSKESLFISLFVVVVVVAVVAAAADGGGAAAAYLLICCFGELGGAGGERDTF